MEGSKVTTQPFDSSISPTFPRSFAMQSYAAPFAASDALDARAMVREERSGDEALSDVSNVVRGVSWALSIEGGAALLFYVIWHLWHVWR
jgi:hypothetical protein